jgi:1-acyl-sn-glycerol-3-phosphate acyltransferase
VSVTWDGDGAPEPYRITGAGWLRLILRGGAILAILIMGVLLTLLLRLLERPIFGAGRPWTPFITQTVCRLSFLVLGMRHEVSGQPMRHPGAVVANHASWLDIFALNARKRVYFVSKSEVANWPGIGFLAQLTGTVFISRDRRAAKEQQAVFEERLLMGHKLLFFPEGTSTDGMRVLPFKSTLFEAFFADALRDALWVQPVTVIYEAHASEDVRFYGWWGDMDFGTHLVKVLAVRRNGAVRVVYHAPLKVSDYPSRKALAQASEKAVRDGMPEARRVRT